MKLAEPAAFTKGRLQQVELGGQRLQVGLLGTAAR